MAIAIGKMDNFDEGSESWTCYEERLEQYFLANEVGDEKKVPVLLSLIGIRTYQNLRDLCAPTAPKEKNEDLC